MNGISIKQFINQWLSAHVKNKIFHYVQESALVGATLSPDFEFGEYVYKTKTMDTLDKFFPFRNDEYHAKIHTRQTAIPWGLASVSSRQSHTYLKFVKSMKTVVTASDAMVMKDKGNITIKKQNDYSKTIELSCIDMQNLEHIEYINETEVTECMHGLLLNRTEIIYAHYKPYNSGTLRKYCLHKYNVMRVISTTPIQMLWQIKHSMITMKALRALAQINKIDGRSKFKTRGDYINAFMRL